MPSLTQHPTENRNLAPQNFTSAPPAPRQVTSNTLLFILLLLTRTSTRPPTLTLTLAPILTPTLIPLLR